MVISPIYFGLVLLTPRSAHWHRGRTLRAIMMGLMTQAAVLWVLQPLPTESALVLVMGVGQFVTLLWLNQGLRSPPHESLQVDRSTP